MSITESIAILEARYEVAKSRRVFEAMALPPCPICHQRVEYRDDSLVGHFAMCSHFIQAWDEKHGKDHRVAHGVVELIDDDN